MSASPKLGYPLQEAGSQQTDAVQNTFVAITEAWLQCVVQSVGDAAPPVSPAAGACYIVGAGTGAWAGHDDELARYDGGWQFYPPGEGFCAKDLDSGNDYEFVSDAWSVKSGGAGIPEAPIDGQEYVRKNGAWALATGGGGGGTTTKWLVFDGATLTLKGGSGAHVITRTSGSPGFFTITWDTPFATANYACSITANDDNIHAISAYSAGVNPRTTADYKLVVLVPGVGTYNATDIMVTAVG